MITLYVNLHHTRRRIIDNKLFLCLLLTIVVIHEPDTTRVPRRQIYDTLTVTLYVASVVDIDECDNDPCAREADCHNLPGTYECVCARGYLGDGVTCSEEDECVTGRHLCSPRAKCVNTVGSYVCDCEAGYRAVEAKCDGGSHSVTVLFGYIIVWYCALCTLM